MKKHLLTGLIAVLGLSFGADAQNLSVNENFKIHKNFKKNVASKRSQVEGTWMNFAETCDNQNTTESELSSAYLFPDTTIIAQYGSPTAPTFARPFVHGYATILDPTYEVYTSGISNATRYSVDSVSIQYGYDRASAPGIVDTLVVRVFSVTRPTFKRSAQTIYYNPTYSSTNYGIDTVSMRKIDYDFRTNRPIIDAAVQSKVISLPLTPADSTSEGKVKAFKVGVNVNPGDLAVAVVEFHPGFTWTLNDTINKIGNAFYMMSTNEHGSIAGNGWPTAISNDWNQSSIIQGEARYDRFAANSALKGIYLPAYVFTQPGFSFDQHIVGFYATATAGVANISASGVKLFQNMPNPFTGSSSIRYEMPTAGKVSLEIVDLSGKVVYTESAMANKGVNTFNVNSSNFSKGVFFYSLEVNGERLTKKMVVTE